MDSVARPHLDVEGKVGRDGEINAEERARHGLHVRRELDARDGVDEAVDLLAELWRAHELAEVRRREVDEALPADLLLLELRA